MKDKLKEAFVRAFDSGDAELAAKIVFDCFTSDMDVKTAVSVLGSAKEEEEDLDGKVSGWAKLEVYKDKEGREIAAFKPTGGKDRRVVLRGVVTLTMNVQMHPGMPAQPQQQRYEFPFKKGTSLRHAMETFDKVSEEAVENLKKEQTEKKKQIISASGMPPIIGMNGKPLLGRPRG